MMFFISCTVGHEPYFILEFPGDNILFNYSKSGNLMFGETDSLNPPAVVGSRGDLFINDNDNIFIYDGTYSQNRFLFENDDWVLNVNDKITTVSIPDNDKMIPWFENMEEKDLSALQFIKIGSKLPESYLPYLDKLAKIKPDAGFYGIESFADMTGLLKIFNPKYIVGADLLRSDYEMLSGLTNLEILAVSLGDSVFNDPLPSIPELKQLFLTDMDEDIVLTADFLINNKQIERIFIQKNGSLDFSILKPISNLKELVLTQSNAIINFDLINDHKNLEVLSLGNDDLEYNQALIRLPALRWMTFNSNVTQEEFNSFIDIHPDLEIIQLIGNDTLSNLKVLSKLSNLFGLTITDTVTDIESIKKLSTLKYLSLPNDFLENSLNKVEIQRSLPGTRIAANEGFCLGSGWLLLLIPFVMIIRFFGRQQNKSPRIQ
jgi:hypothetical protein